MEEPDPSRVVRVVAGGFALAIVPDRGGKIVSLCDPSGREWLHTSDRIGRPGGRFGDAEMAGWDECIPTVTACVVAGRALPDHGDAWDVPWRGGASALTVTGASWPYRLTRTITAAGAGIRLAYRAEATAGPVPLLWVAHPQFRAPAGTRVILDPAPDRVVDVLDDARPERPWTATLGEIDGVPAGGCRKLYVHPGERVGSARLVHRDGASLRMSWSCDYVGVWLDRGAYADGPVIAIEPSIGYADALTDAIARGTAPLLIPGVPLEWWIDVSVSREGD